MSFIPDGVLVSSGTGGNQYNNLNATLNAKFTNSATWQAEFYKAAQNWAQYANINFAVVGDNGTVPGQGLYQQGDPGMGDIRFAGYSFSNNYLGYAYLPNPINNYDIAGDVNFDTKFNLNIGSTYDIQTIAMHEIGHTLGLDHSTSSTSVMYATYNGSKRAISSDDIQGVQAIYGARQADIYGNLNNTFLTAASLTSLLDPLSLTAVVNNLDLTTTSSAEYFAVVAPLGTNGTFTVNVQSSGVSLLRPAVTVYAANMITVLGSAASPSTQYTGDSLTVNVSGVSAGQVFFVKVRGADSTPFATGNYDLRMNFGTGSLPSFTFANTQELDGNPLTGGSGEALDMYEAAMPVLVAPNTWVVGNLTIYSNFSSAMITSLWTGVTNSSTGSLNTVDPYIYLNLANYHVTCGSLTTGQILAAGGLENLIDPTTLGDLWIW
jgi:hypothetical protein